MLECMTGAVDQVPISILLFSGIEILILEGLMLSLSIFKVGVVVWLSSYEWGRRGSDMSNFLVIVLK